MIHIPNIYPGDRLTIIQKLLLIIQENEDKRNSYDLLTNEFYKRNPDSNITQASLERKIRVIQYELGIYPPTQRVRKLRKEKQIEIIEKSKLHKKQGFFVKILSKFITK